MRLPLWNPLINNHWLGRDFDSFRPLAQHEIARRTRWCRCFHPPRAAAMQAQHAAPACSSYPLAPFFSGGCYCSTSSSYKILSNPPLIHFRSFFSKSSARFFKHKEFFSIQFQNFPAPILSICVRYSSIPWKILIFFMKKKFMSCVEELA